MMGILIPIYRMILLNHPKIKPIKILSIHDSPSAVKWILKLTKLTASARLTGMKILPKIMAVSTAIVLALALAGCKHGAHSDAPSVPKDQIHELTKVGAIKAPDGFRNVFYGCLGTTEVFITSAGENDTLPSSVTVVPNADYCILDVDKTPG